jgi:hypothetical protein
MGDLAAGARLAGQQTTRAESAFGLLTFWNTNRAA